MKRVKLIVAYDGTNYCGWQVQPNGETIESMLNRHLTELLKEEIHVIGASRTDSGVHADGNVAVFDTNARMPADRISYAMNTRLPADIRIQDSCEVPPDFHPRYSAVAKEYLYRFYDGFAPDPFKKGLAYHERKTLDTVGYISEVSVSCKDGLATAHIKTEHKDIYEVSRQIFYAFSYEGQALLEMTLKKASLEDVFIELTEGSAPADMPHDADNSNSETETYLADSEVTDK